MREISGNQRQRLGRVRVQGHVCEHVCVCVCGREGEKAARASPQSPEFPRDGGTEHSAMQGVPIPGGMSLSPCPWVSLLLGEHP